jgi:hypothetical protein
MNIVLTLKGLDKQHRASPCAMKSDRSPYPERVLLIPHISFIITLSGYRSGVSYINRTMSYFDIQIPFQGIYYTLKGYDILTQGVTL